MTITSRINMKKLIFFLGVICFSLSWTACETKYDANGDLDGMWQMLRWYDKQTAEVVADKNDGIYYCVQLKLMKFVTSENAINYYLAYFNRQKDSLTIGKIVHYPTDSVCPMSVLEPFGVPADGRFHIDALTSDRMTLSTDAVELTFRKY